MTDLSEIVLAGILDGKQQKDIALETGRSTSCILRQVKKLRAEGRLNDTSGDTLTIKVAVPPNIYNRLHHEAYLRNLGVQGFVTRMLVVIATDDLATAILDDQPPERDSDGGQLQ